MRTRLFFGMLWFFAAALIILGKAAFAHTPVDISLIPDFGNSTLAIKVQHPITAGEQRKHYLKSIEVTIDDRPPLIYSFTFQKGDFQQIDVIIPDLKNVGNVTVKACHNTCLEKTFDIKAMVDRTSEQ